jgi:hypothetical protein
MLNQLPNAEYDAHGDAVEQPALNYHSALSIQLRKAG